jgi:hypothetical protein
MVVEVKAKTKELITQLLRTYYYWVLLPAGAYLLLYSSYYAVTKPELLSYQKNDCLGTLDCEPVSGTVNILGVPISKEYTPPILNDEEYAAREKANLPIEICTYAAVLLAIGYYAVQGYKKIRRDKYDFR